MKKIRTVFVLDNSLSMNSVGSTTGVNISKLDMAKSFVELFCDHTLKKTEFNCGQCTLVTYDANSAIKTHFEDSASVLKNACKIIQTTSSTNGDNALQVALNYINRLSCAEDSDSPGYGRYLFKSKQFAIFWLTDGEQFLSFDSDNKPVLRDQVQIPPLSDFGLPLYDQPFRWDWFFFPVLIGDSVNAKVKQECERLAQKTCGQVLQLNSSLDVRAATEVLTYHEKRTKANRAFFSHLEGSLSYCCVARFEPYQHGGSFATREPIKIYLKSYHYLHGAPPMAEPIWPGDYDESMVLRGNPQPLLQYDSKNLVAENYTFPPNTRFEEAEIERTSWLAQYASSICKDSRKSVSFAVFVANQIPGKPPLGPVGIIEHVARVHADGLGRTVLKILPYNWPVLFQLVTDIESSSQRERPPRALLERLASYIKGIPQYYMNSLQKQFEVWQLHHLLKSSELHGVKGVQWRVNFNEKISEIQKRVFPELMAQQKLITEQNKLQTAHKLAVLASADASDGFQVSFISQLRHQLARDLDFRQPFEDAKHCLPMQEATQIRFPVRMRKARELPELEQWKDEWYGKNKYYTHDLWRRFIRHESKPQLPPLFENEGESDMEDVDWQFQNKLKEEFTSLKQHVRSEALYESSVELSPLKQNVCEYGGRLRPYVRHFPGKSASLKRRIPRLNDDILVVPAFLFPTRISAEGTSGSEIDDIVDSIFSGQAAKFLSEQSAIRAQVCSKKLADPFKQYQQQLVDDMFDKRDDNDDYLTKDNSAAKAAGQPASEQFPPSPSSRSDSTSSSLERMPFISIASPQAKNRSERYEMETQRGYDSSLLSNHNQHVIVLDDDEIESYTRDASLYPASNPYVDEHYGPSEYMSELDRQPNKSKRAKTGDQTSAKRSLSSASGAEPVLKSTRAAPQAVVAIKKETDSAPPKRKRQETADSSVKFSSGNWKKQIDDIINAFSAASAADSVRDVKGKVAEMANSPHLSDDDKIALFSYAFNQSKKKNCAQIVKFLKKLSNV